MVAATERIGKFDFSVATCEPRAETGDLPARRQETLTAWLLAQWDREHEGERESLAALAERN